MNDPPPQPAFPAPRPATTPDANVHFHRELEALTPHVFVTHVLVAINVVVFVVMLLNGVDPMTPTVDSLRHWGADYAPQTLGGEPWRAITATFIHIGVLHIAMNMFALYVVGPTVERLFGNVGYLVLYLSAGISGSLVSIVASPAVVSAGASGAVFGLYGALLAFVLRNRGSIPPAVLGPLARWALIVVGGNIVFGMRTPGIDMGAHLGGLGGGFLGGLLLAHPMTREAAQSRWWKALVLAGITAVVAIAALFGLPRPADVEAEFARFDQVQTDAVNAVNDDAERADRSEMSEDDFANDVEKRALAPWHEQRVRMEALRLRGTPAAQLARILAYMRVREEGWRLLVDGLRRNDPALMEQAADKQREASALAEPAK